MNDLRKCILQPILAIAALSLLAACGSTAGGGAGGGGGVQTVGGAADAPCSPEYHNEGCFTTKRMKCDATTSKWAQIADCAPAGYCVELADPGAPGTAKKVTECKVAGTAGGTDAGGTDPKADGVSQDGGGSTVPKKTPAEEVACVQQKCPSDFSACSAYAACAKLLGCVAACSDEACADKCGEGASLEDTQLLILLGAMDKCGKANACIVEEEDPVCGDGKCEDPETAGSCPSDCKSTGPKCGNGTCESGESVETCPSDCKSTGPKCGNGTCESGESVETCPSDCKSTGPKCGNEICESGETKESCPMDCGSPIKCGDGKCESPENASSCPADCGSATVCGDGKCTSPENATTCVVDCDSNYTPMIPCVLSKCSSQYNACAAKSGCLNGLNCVLTCDKNDQGDACFSSCVSNSGAAASALTSLIQCSAACLPSSGCTSDTQCKSGEKCIEGTCMPTTSGCTMDSQCKTGEKCVSGKCTPSTTGCTSDTQCGSGMKCVSGKCEAASTGTCKDKCGGEGTGGCYCDEACKKYGDCCPDYETLCAP